MSNEEQGCPPIQEDPEFYKRLLESLSDGVYFTDRERRIQFWNEWATRITGYSKEEAIGHLCQDNLLSHTDATGQALCTAQCPLRTTLVDGRAREAQVFLRHKDGRQVPVRIRVNPLLSEKREIVGAVEIFSDDSAHRTMTRRAEEMERLA